MARILYPHKRSISFDPALYQSLAQVAHWRGSSVAQVVRGACMEAVAKEYKAHKTEPPHDTRQVLPGQGEFALSREWIEAPETSREHLMSGPNADTAPLGDTGPFRFIGDPVTMRDVEREAGVFFALTGGIEPDLPTGGTPEELLAHIGRLHGELAACIDHRNPPLPTTMAALHSVRVAAGQGGTPLPCLSETGARRLNLQLRRRLFPDGKLPVTP